MNRRNRKKKQTNLFDDLMVRVKKVNLNVSLSWWKQLPKFHQRIIAILSSIVLVLLVLPTSDIESETEVSSSTKNRVQVSVNTTSLSQEGVSKQAVTKTDDWQEYTVQSGDTLAKVFRTNKLPMADLNLLVKIEGLDKPLSKITQGQLVRYKLTAKGDLDILQLEKNDSSVMFFRLSDGGFGRSK